MHTINEAKDLWCPMARVASAHKPEGETEYVIDPAVYNRVAVRTKPTLIPRSCNCMADRCSMWRWNSPHVATHTVKDGTPEATTAPEVPPAGAGPDWEFIPYDSETAQPAHWAESQQAANAARRRGSCGLAPVQHT